MNVPLTPLEFRERAVSLYRDKIGIVDGDKRFTYGDYDQRVNRLANSFTGLRVSKGDVVSFITYNSHQLLEAYFAIPQISAILNPVNIRLSHHEIEFILNHAETRVLCFHQDFLPLVEIMRPQLPGVEYFIILEAGTYPDWTMEYEHLLDSASPDAEVDLDSIDEDAVIELFYTSGTTGKPKGARLTHRGCVSNIFSLMFCTMSQAKAQAVARGMAPADPARRAGASGTDPGHRDRRGSRRASGPMSRFPVTA